MGFLLQDPAGEGRVDQGRQGGDQVESAGRGHQQLQDGQDAGPGAGEQHLCGLRGLPARVGLSQPRGGDVYRVQWSAQEPRVPHLPGEVPLPGHSLTRAGGQDHQHRQHRIQLTEGDRPAARHQAFTRGEDQCEAEIYPPQIQRGRTQHLNNKY